MSFLLENNARSEVTTISRIYVYTRVCVRVSRATENIAQVPCGGFASHPLHFRGRYPVLHYFNTLRMLFLSRGKAERQAGVRARRAGGDETPTEREFDDFVKCPGASLTLIQHSCGSACTFVKFRFLGTPVRPAETSKLAIYMCRKFAMKQKLGLLHERRTKVRKRIN